MSTSFWWVFDFLVIAIAVYIVIVNAKRGVTKSIVLGIDRGGIAAGCCCGTGALSVCRI